MRVSSSDAGSRARALRDCEPGGEERTQQRRLPARGQERAKCHDRICWKRWEQILGGRHHGERRI